MAAGTGLNFSVVPPETQQAFELLSVFNYLNDPQWYLAGGTALALQVGHRQSVDLDFFTSQPDFDKSSLERQLLQAEPDPLPQMDKAIDWNTVQHYFEQTVAEIVQNGHTKKAH